MDPLVSISCLAYNQEKYVRETLDGFIMQKTSFPFEVIIHDDCSNDRTAMIIREYESRRPEMFRAIYQTENQMSKSGGGVIVQNTFAQARGKYIAMCEGDDYWTDPLKLQKQVDFLEANPDYVLCCHNSTVQYEDGKTSHPAKTRVWDTLTTKELILNYNDFTRDFLVCPAHTSSLMFKNHLLPQLPGWLSQGIAVDLPLIILLSQYGKAKFINELMSVYRIHPAGVSSSRIHQGSLLQRGRIHMYENLLMTMDPAFSPYFREVLGKYYDQKKKIEQGTQRKVVSDITKSNILPKAFSESNLLHIFDTLKNAVLNYINTMKTGDKVGVYKYAFTTKVPNIYASTYACMTLSLLGKMDMLSDAQKKDWLHYFDRFQNPEDGLFYDPVIRNELFDQTDWWGARHLAVQVAQCYVILGGRPKHKIKCLEKYYNLSVFADYLNSLNIDDHNSDVDNHIMNLGVLLQYNRDVFEDKSAAEAVSFLQQWLRNKLNKNTGLWGRNTPQTPQEISRAIQFYYHLFVLFEYDNLNLPQIERVVDYALKTQNENGGFGVKLNSSACEDIDSMDILIRYTWRTEYRNKDILFSLMRGFQWVLSNFDQTGGAFFQKNGFFRYGHPEMSTPAGVPSMFATWFRMLNLTYLMYYFASVLNYQKLDMAKSIANAPGYTFLKRNLSFKRYSGVDDKSDVDYYFQIFTHLTKEELLKLKEIATPKKNGIFVEIGSYLGASSNFLALACRDNKSLLYCVDTWQNHSMSEGPRDTYQEFCNNTRGLSDHIVALKGFSTQIATRFDNKIDLLFLDGDHNYEGIKSDWDCWKNKLADDAIVIFHDWGWADGVKKVIQNDVLPFVKNSGYLPNMWWGTIDKEKINMMNFASMKQNCHQQTQVGSQMDGYVESRCVPKLSVIIPTCNRASSLERTLHSLTRIHNPGCSYEIIVVDNGSTDSTRQIAEFFQRTLLPELKYIAEPNPGLHNGRHRGAFEAAGAILCYLDDDVKVDPMWLRSVRETFETTEAVLVGGKILPEYEQSPPDWFKEFVKPIRGGGYHIGQLTLIDMGEELRQIDPIYVWGANFSIRKEVLFDCGGFHPDSMPKELIYLRGDGETGLSIAIKDKGLKAFYHPGVMVRHCISKDRLTKEYFNQRMFSQGISDSFTEIRKLGKLPEAVFPDAPNPHQQGKIFHYQQIQNNPQLLSWILKREYYSELKVRLSSQKGSISPHQEAFYVNDCKENKSAQIKDVAEMVSY